MALSFQKKFYLAIIFLVVPGFFWLSEALADTTPPVTQTALSPASPDGSNGWYRTPVEITFSASDLGSGIKSINWRIGNGTWNSTFFGDSLNLTPNSSFEDDVTPPITSWIFSGTPGSAGTRDTVNSKFPLASAKVVSPQNGWSGFNNQIGYIPVTPFANMSASVWVKTEDISGSGAYFKIYALHSSGSTLIAQSAAITGTSDWVRLAKTFYVSVNDAYGVYLDSGINGIGTAWYDGISVASSPLDTSVTQTFSQNGSYSVEYYATDQDGNQELPHRSLDLKIDTSSPSNWRNFETTRVGNDHTLTAEIDVGDDASGIDGSSGYFQYSLDGGQTWGHNSSLLNCNSNWISDGWHNLTTTLSNSGLTANLETPAVDYCSSDWAVCKVVRFKTVDLSGNSATKDICINGSWFRVTGDVGSRKSVNPASAGASDNTDGMIISASSIASFTSSNNWYITDYLLPQKLNYDEWFALFPTTTALPSGKLPKTSGIFINNGSFTISATTLPSGFSSAQFSAVVYVNGDLTINTDFNLLSTSALAFIVSGDIRVDKGVKDITAFFISDGKFDAAYNGNSSVALIIKGSVVVDYLAVNRSLKPREGGNQPVIDIIYQPIYLTTLTSLMGSDRISWREITP